MLLTLDVGNTNIKSALYEGSENKDYKVHSNVDKLFKYLDQVSFDNSAITSFNPGIKNKIEEKLSSKNISIFEAKYQDKLNLKINYETPSTLGMDRVCSAVGALQIAINENLISDDQYLISVDLGTATTLNIVSPDRQFVGGLIAPGIQTMLNSLNKNTAQLPLPDLNDYKILIGNSTNASIVSGVIHSTKGLIMETINKLKIDARQEPLIFVTGGNAKFILPHLKFKVFFDECLVLIGLNIIYNLNN
jgi:type III pantothenate kinase